MFGWAFNYFVGSLEDRKDGYLAMLVAAGVGITLIGAAIISWQAAALVLACFVASGIPMIIGEITRSIQKRERALKIQRLIAEAEAKEILGD
jgi:ACR3 family arsenite efflux pump ArsB